MGSDPVVGDVRLKVDMKPQRTQAIRPAAAYKAQAKSQAQMYLDRHGIEEKLSRCVKLLLQNQPDDPMEFICSQLRDKPAPVVPGYKQELPRDEPCAPPVSALANALQALGPMPLKADKGLETVSPPQSVSKRDQLALETRDLLAKASLDGSLLQLLQAPVDASNQAEDLRLSARDKLVNAAKDGRLHAACREVAAEIEDMRHRAWKSLTAAASNGSLDAAVDQANITKNWQSTTKQCSAQDVEAVRQKVTRVLMETASDGRLRDALSEFTQDVEALRQNVISVLLECASDGRLYAALSEVNI